MCCTIDQFQETSFRNRKGRWIQPLKFLLSNEDRDIFLFSFHFRFNFSWVIGQIIFLLFSLLVYFFFSFWCLCRDYYSFFFYCAFVCKAKVENRWITRSAKTQHLKMLELVQLDLYTSVLCKDVSKQHFEGQQHVFSFSTLTKYILSSRLCISSEM